MSDSNTTSPPRLAWYLKPYEIACRQLEEVSFPTIPTGPGEYLSVGQVGILYSYGSGPGTEIVTWLQPTDDVAYRHLRKEADSGNQFDRWLERVWPIGIWHLATAWALYEQWLTHEGTPHWQACLTKRFTPQTFLDQLLAHSGGWILWRFQLENLIFAAVGEIGRARDLARQWVLQSPGIEPQLAGIVLPDGSYLRAALQDRSYTAGSGRISFAGHPQMPVIARIHAIFSESLGEGRT